MNSASYDGHSCVMCYKHRWVSGINLGANNIPHVAADWVQQWAYKKYGPAGPISGCKGCTNVAYIQRVVLYAFLLNLEVCHA